MVLNLAKNEHNENFDSAYKDLVDSIVNMGSFTERSNAIRSCLKHYNLDDEETLITQVHQVNSAFWLNTNMVPTGFYRLPFSPYTDQKPLRPIKPELLNNADVVRTCLYMALTIDFGLKLGDSHQHDTVIKFLKKLSNNKLSKNTDLREQVGVALLGNRWEALVTLCDIYPSSFDNADIMIRNIPNEILVMSNQALDLVLLPDNINDIK